MILTFLLFLLESENASSQSYDSYHRLISTAEEFYFLENNTDSSMHYYQKCFQAFEFVFARDAVNDFQIALKEKRAYDYFLITAMKSGVSPSILSSIPALSGFVKDTLPNLELMKDYDMYRSRYLGRINVNCLNRTYFLGVIDQISKYNGKTQTSSLFEAAMEFGLPGERNCGIEELGINKELGSRATDFIYIRDSISQVKGRNLSYYSLDENSLLMHIPIVIMLHNYCTYKYYEATLREAFLKGFIHPREVGLIYDNAYRGDRAECLMVPNLGVFGLNTFVVTSNIQVEMANRLRLKWGICSIQTDRKKKELEKLGYKFLWDYW